jgi:rhodanese-related sulfurtransferase
LGRIRRIQPTLFLHVDAEVEFPSTGVRDGEELHLGQIVIRVVHTPVVATEPVIEVPRVAPSAAPAWIAEHDAVVLDVREPDEYVAGHVPAAVSIPQAELAVQLPRLPRDRDVLVACRSGARSLGAARFLRALGYDRVANLEDGTLRWVDAGNPLEAR